MPAQLPRDTNRAYGKRVSKRQRTLGLQASVDAATSILIDLVEHRKRRGNRAYRWTDLIGTERIDMLRQVRDCALAAMTTYEVAEHFGVKEGTLQEWIIKDPEFAIALRLPRDLADERVEKALYHRAIGYNFRSEEIKITEAGEVHRVPIVKHIPPDIGAATFWLKNRKAHVWKDKVDVNVEGVIDINDKSEDPRMLAMAVLDVLQQAIYEKLPVTIDGHAAVAKESIAEYTDADFENMSQEEIEALFEADPDEDRE